MGITGESMGYTIAAVSRLTGIGCHALRTWERRHGFPIPSRNASGQRRYPEEQVRMLLHAAEALRAGGSVGEILGKLRDDLAGSAESVPLGDGDDVAPSRVLSLLLLGDLDAAAHAYAGEAAGKTALPELLEILEPALVELGDRWHRGEASIFQVRLAWSFLRSKITVLMDLAQGANSRPSRSALVGAMQGERHEGGVLILGVLLELSGWRALVLGADVPAREWQEAIDLWHPDAVCVSFILARSINKRFRELGGLRGAPVFVGGRSILNYQGLARRHGLRPLSGPVRECVARLIAAVERGDKRRGPPP